MGLSKLRAAATNAKATKAKSSTPSVTASEAVGKAIVAFKAAKRKEKEAAAELANAEAELLPESARLRLEQCHSDSTVHASVRLEADTPTGKESLLFTQKDQYKKMTGEAQDTIRLVVGEENFDKWFDVKTTYSFDEEALEKLPNADEVVEALLTALGPNADKILTATTLVVPNERYTRDTIFDAKAQKIADRLQADGLAIPYKGSFR